MTEQIKPITMQEQYAKDNYKEPYHCTGKRCGVWIDASNHTYCPACGEKVCKR